MKFCSECSQPVSFIVPPDDTRPRYVCSHCGTIHYQNPRMIIGSIPVWEADGKMQILLCKRAIEPRHGYWTLPAGFMENSETTAEAAVRETVEEAGANIALLPLFSLLNVPHADQVHIFYRAKLLDLDYMAGVESLEVKLFTATEIPWDDIAFPTVSHTLRLFLDGWKKVQNGGKYDFHTYDILKSLDKSD